MSGVEANSVIYRIKHFQRWKAIARDKNLKCTIVFQACPSVK